MQVRPAGQAGYPTSLVASLDTVPVKCCVPLLFGTEFYTHTHTHAGGFRVADLRICLILRGQEPTSQHKANTNKNQVEAKKCFNTEPKSHATVGKSSSNKKRANQPCCLQYTFEQVKSKWQSIPTRLPNIYEEQIHVHYIDLFKTDCVKVSLGTKEF